MTVKIAAVVMRAQPPHKSHFWLIRQGLELGERVVVVLGSCFQARTPKNPFTGPERQTMIRLGLTDAENARVDFVMMRDYYDNARWAAAVKAAVESFGGTGREVVLVGHEKDASSRYLNSFPGWALAPLPRNGMIDATTIREAIYASSNPAIALAAISDLIEPAVSDYLQVHLVRPEWRQLRAEQQKYEREAALWGPPPANYTRAVLCADAVVQWNNEVILIQRGPGIGEGLLAFPGGHVDGAETTFDAAVRELREEVGIGLMREEFERSLVGQCFFEAAGRSQRPGRVVSMAYHFVIRSSKRPVIESVSAEARPMWMKIADLPALEGQFFEDHFVIGDRFLTLT